MARRPLLPRPAGGATPADPRTAAGGYAVILLLVLLVMGSMYGLLASVDAATAQVEQRQRDETQQILRQAKDALIAWSAARPDSVAPPVPGPGHLPCPDDNNDGVSNTVSCGTAATRTGRLPWNTLGLPDLRDSSGERLWYAVSRCFLERTPDVFCSYAVNSDTQGQLTVTGLTPASNVVAIIFAPGPALAGQNRTGAGANVAANYLEGENGDASNDVFEARVRCLAGDGSCPGGTAFNDQMILITHADLFDAVETVVAKRLETQIKPAIQAHYAAWQAVAPLPREFYPFAAPFDDADLLMMVPPRGPPTNPSRSTTNYLGRVGQTHGLLPVTRDAAWVAWFGVSVTKVGGAPTTNFTAVPNCVLALSDLTCTFTYSGAFGGMRVSIQGTLANAARSFVLPLDASRIAVTSAVTVTPVSAIPQHTIDPATGNLAINYQIDVPATAGAQSVEVRFAKAFPPFTDPDPTSNPALAWFWRNNWHRLTYYAASPAVVPGGSGTCTPPPLPAPPPVLESCLQVQNAPAPDNDKRVVLTLAGRNLAPGVRTWTIANYFEGANASGTPLFDTPAPDYVFRRDLRSPAFNDRVVIVSP